ncbi:MAG TPA: shikimate kinase [Flavobacterium sp.]|jgi:shikimate kinase
MKKIILLGYMGSGKSVVARILHHQTKLPSIDLDNFIEKKAGASVSHIFKNKGEIFFRKLERSCLEEVIAAPGNAIISLGGGTPCYSGNHEFLQNESVVSFYLRAKPAALAQRLADEIDSRPLLDEKVGEALEEFIAKHLFDRSFYYNQAHHKIDTDNSTPEEVAAKILRLLA